MEGGNETSKVTEGTKSKLRPQWVCLVDGLTSCCCLLRQHLKQREERITSTSFFFPQYSANIFHQLNPLQKLMDTRAVKVNYRIFPCSDIELKGGGPRGNSQMSLTFKT